MRTITASNARQTLPAQLDHVEAGEEVQITRHGKVVAVLVRPDLLRARRAPEAWRVADEIGDRLAAARRNPLPQAPISTERAEALARAVDGERDGR